MQYHPDALLNIKQVAKLTTLSRSEIYRRIQGGQFPPPVRLGARRVAWHHSDVRAWLDHLGPPTCCPPSDLPEDRDF